MKPLVIDASIAIKWVVPELDTAAAIALRSHYHLIAPDLLLLECANALWKKVRRRELTAEEAMVSAEAFGRAELELVRIQAHFQTIANLSVAIDHPPYDCAYLALALARKCQFVTADRQLKSRVALSKNDLQDAIVLLADLDQ